MLAHVCDASIQVEAGGSGIQGSPGDIERERPCLKIETEDRTSPHTVPQAVIHSAGFGGSFPP